MMSRAEREARAARRLRQKSRSAVSHNVRPSVREFGPERVEAGRVVRDVVCHKTLKTRRAFVVRLVIQNKSARRAFLHFATQNGLTLSACEFLYQCPAGVDPSELGPDALANAYVVSGPAAGLKALLGHKFVIGFSRLGAASHRMRFGTNDPLGPAPVYRKPKANKPKPKQRHAGTRMVIVGVERKVIEEPRPFGVVRKVKRYVPVWEARTVGR